MREKIKVLVVDDEERFLNALSQRLSLRDFDVTPATSAKKAMELAREGEFDIAIVDLKMPEMSGEELLEALKEEHPLMEVVILTGHGSTDSMVQCTRVGSYGYLQKPSETSQLMEVLKDAYQRRVSRKLNFDRKKIEELIHLSAGESALDTLRKLKRLEEGSDS